MPALEAVLAASTACAAGVAAMLVWSKRRAEAALALATSEAESVRRDGRSAGESARAQVLDEARARVETLRSTLRADLERRERAIVAEDQRLDARTATLERQREEAEASSRELDAAFEGLDARSDGVRERRAEVEVLERQVSTQVEARAGVTREAAREELAQDALSEAQLAAQKSARLREEHARAQAEPAARQMIDLVCQRYGTALATERTVSSVALPAAGKIRDRLMAPEGGLVSALQAMSGVEFQLQPDGETLYLAINDGYQREIARLTFEKLIKDKEPNEASLKRLFDKSSADLERIVRTAGNKAAEILKIGKVHPEILMLVGKLLYRTSYTQNQWAHAIETAHLCGMMAEDLGADARAARRSALIHDIGKVLWVETEATGSHAVSGAAFAAARGESPEIVHPIAAHHNDEKPDSVLAHIVAAADALSGARPGARRATEEAYSMRIEDLERICLSMRGIESHFVIQGGRELRIMVDQDRVDDAGAVRMSNDIAGRIEDELTYPGQIKVTVIRETRASAVAR
jgi:ribonuclease Y